MKTVTARVRHESRRLIRELGFVKTDFTPAGVTHQQSHTLLEIGNYGGISALDLANYLNLDKSTVSRVVAQLQKMKMISCTASANDKRRKLIKLTPKGERKYAEINEKSDEIVNEALRYVSPAEAESIIEGMRLYAAALRKSRVRQSFKVRAIKPSDNSAVADVIRTVMPEFGCDGPGFAMRDAEVENMCESYSGNKSAYFVLLQGDNVIGGGGFAPLKGGPKDTCELKKMYFLPEARGTGMGRELLMLCLGEAKKRNFRKCYLETARFMVQAQRLYNREGFKRLEGPLGNTGHHACDLWYLKDL